MQVHAGGRCSPFDGLEVGRLEFATLGDVMDDA